MENERIILINELLKPARKNYPRRAYVIKQAYDTFGADLISLIPYKEQNNGHTFILLVIDHMTKFCYLRALKNKETSTVAKAMENILDSCKCSPKSLLTDEGKEFVGKQFRQLMKKYKINHYHTYSGFKNAIAERVIGTIKRKLWKHFFERGSFEWLSILQQIAQEYNATPSSRTKFSPIEILSSKNIQRKLLRTIYKKRVVVMSQPKFKTGEYVRISLARDVFKKSYWENWSFEPFIIDKIYKHTNPHTYSLIDLDKKPIKGRFYEMELQKTKVPFVYLIKRIIRKSRNFLTCELYGYKGQYKIKNEDVL